MSEHTPGPWTAEQSEATPNFWAIATREGGDVCYLSLNPARVAANARLIAAAPDMLAALKTAHQFISNGVELGFLRMPDASTPDPAHETPGLIAAAIRLAETGSRT